MIKTLRQLFESRLQSGLASPDAKVAEHAMRLATAALLIEVARADHDFALDERCALESMLQEVYGLTDGEASELMTTAEAEVDAAVSLDQFTKLLNRNLSPEQKQRVMRMLWEVAFVDGRVDKYEDYLIRKLADLLHVPHRNFIKAKLDVAETLKADKSA